MLPASLLPDFVLTQAHPFLALMLVQWGDPAAIVIKYLPLPPPDLKPWVSNFTYPGAQDFSQLALDPSRNQLIVGAR